MTTIDLRDAPPTEVRRPSTFVASVLVLTEQQLNQPHFKDARKYLEELDPSNKSDALVDRLLVRACPELRSALQRHEKGGPKLVHMMKPDALKGLDIALAALVPELARIYPKVLSDALEAENQLAPVFDRRLREIASASAPNAASGANSANVSPPSATTEHAALEVKPVASAQSGREGRNSPVQVNLNHSEKEQIQEAAKALGLSLSGFLRAAALEKAQTLKEREASR